MAELTTLPIPVVVACVGLLGAALGWAVSGLGFLLKRRLTQSARTEEATYLNNVTDLAAKLRAQGMTIEDVRSFEEMMRSPSVVASEGVVRLLDGSDHSVPTEFGSNVALKGRAGAAYDVAEAKLEQALLDLQLLLNENQNAALEETQLAWKRFRAALEQYAFMEYEGGTHAPLAMVLAGLSETERRTEQILEDVRERSSR